MTDRDRQLDRLAKLLALETSPNVHEADSTDFWRCRVHPDDLGGMLDALRAHTESASPTYESTFRLRSNGSGYRLLLSRGRVVERDGQGRAVRVVGTMIDLSQRHPSPRSGVVSGARGGVALAPLEHPFHTLLDAPGQSAGPAARAISATLAEVRDRVLVLVRDLLDASIGQLQRAAALER